MRKNCKQFSRYIFLVIAISLSSVLLVSCGGGGGSSESGSGTSGSVLLSWNPVVTNADGTTITDLGGYRIYYSETSPVQQTGSAFVTVGLVNSAEISGLTPGRVYYFRLSAFDLSGNESALSAEELNREIL